jgi:hypothetical protein
MSDSTNKMKKSSNLTLVVVGGLIAVVLALILTQRPGSTVVVQDSPVKFSSVRKHPFDVYADPYHPPERENPYRDRTYQQVGVLQRDGQSGILPLFGRPSPYSTNKWEYYTMSDGLKLPVSYNSKPCNSETGCDEVVNPDLLSVLGLGSYKANLYDVKQPRYDPTRL